MTKLLLACCLVCLPLRHLQITSGYGYRIHPLTGRYSFHKGIDLRARSDTVFAVLSGKVAAAAYDPLLGIFIRLDHGDFQTLYGHLSQLFVLTGDSVIAGSPLGITGISGRTTGEHLHFGALYHHLPIDPIKFLTLLTNQFYQHKKGDQTMSTYKPLSEQIADKMIMDIKNGTSIFQRPNNSLNAALPFNIESGYKYAGPSALVLLMQKRDDPRWGTSNQANRNHTAVNKGATGTLINFMTQFEYQKVVDEQGEPVLKENGKQRTERVKLEEPKQVDAWLFNGEQMRNMPKWEKEPMELSPVVRAQLILDNSQAVMEHGGDDMFYDRSTDTIVIPEMGQFAKPEQYYAEALHQLAHWTSADDRLNRPVDGGMDESAMILEELRTNLASLFLSKELNLPYNLNEHVGYLNSWSVILKEEPAELFKAASDAQQIVDKIMAFEQKAEEKQEIGAENELEAGQQQEKEPAARPEAEVLEFNSEKLNKGEIIPHNGTEFKVVSELKNKVYNMQNLGTGQKFKMSSKDELYGSLLNAKNYSQERAVDVGLEEQSREETAEEEDHSYQMTR